MMVDRLEMSSLRLIEKKTIFVSSHDHESRSGVLKLWPMGRMWPAIHVYWHNENFQN